MFLFYEYLLEKHLRNCTCRINSVHFYNLSIISLIIIRYILISLNSLKKRFKKIKNLIIKYQMNLSKILKLFNTDLIALTLL